MKRALQKNKLKKEGVFSILSDSIYYLIGFNHPYQDIMEYPVCIYFRVISRVSKIVELKAKMGRL